MILLLTENADEFSAALNTDFGNRPHAVNLVSEVAGILADTSTARSLRYTPRALSTTSRPNARSSGRA